MYRNSELSKLDKPFKLNYKRTIFIGFAYFSILLIWQVYDSWCPTFLTDLFVEAFPGTANKDVQYLVGIMMALDNVAALIMLPIFGRLSDKTHTRIGKRMPYILVGTFLCTIFFPLIPVFFHYHNLAGVISMMAIAVFFATIYRNPEVALMPDITPKPLRSKANGVINIMSYIGVGCSIILGICFSLSEYRESWIEGVGCGNIWTIEIPFLVASLLMVVSAIVLFFTINENKIAIEMKDEMARGEEMSEVYVPSDDDNKPMTKSNKMMLWTLLGAEFLWFMADNGINTFMGNYTVYYLLCEHSSSMVNIIVGSVGSILGFALGVVIANKIGRKWSIFTGLSIAFGALLIWLIFALSIPVKEANPNEGIYNEFPIYLYFVWFVKGFGMSIVHVNSFPMAVDLCSNNKIGQFTGYYFASSMAAQIITPIALGSLLLIPNFTFKLLPLYGLVCLVLAALLVCFIKNAKMKKTCLKKDLKIKQN